VEDIVGSVEAAADDRVAGEPPSVAFGDSRPHDGDGDGDGDGAWHGPNLRSKGRGAGRFDVLVY
jgi:hypothetical protein